MNILRVVQTESAEVLTITRLDKEQTQRRDILQCEHCDAEIDHLHNMYKNIGLCEECYGENADACWEEWLMTRDACR